MADKETPGGLVLDELAALGVRPEEVTGAPADLHQDTHLSDHIAVRIDWLNRAIEQQTHDILNATVGLTSLQWRCIATLFVNGPKNGIQLADALSTSGAQVSRAVRPLINQGLIEAEAGTQKRSYGRLLLTGAGKNIYDQGKQFMQARNRWLLEVLPQEDLTRLYELVGLLRLRVASSPDPLELLSDKHH